MKSGILHREKWFSLKQVAGGVIFYSLNSFQINKHGATSTWKMYSENKARVKRVNDFSRPHLMSSNSPSGGMKLMLCSVSNLLSFTHWWN